MSYNSNSNSHTTTTASGGGISITGLLQVTFIVLKLCHVIDWSWFWVLFPTILGVGFLALVWIIFGIIILISNIQEKKSEKRLAKERAERIKQQEERRKQLAEECKQQEEEKRRKQMEEGITYTITSEDLKNPNFPKLNEWFLSKKFEYQLKYRYEFRSAVLVGGDVTISRCPVFVFFYNQKFQEQERTTSVAAGDVIRIFPCEDKVNTIQIETPSRFALGPGLYEEKDVRTLIFEKTEDSSPKIR